MENNLCDSPPARWETLIDNSFQDRAALVSEWNFNYPWGDTHNGSARMVGSATGNSHVYLPSAGQLQIKAGPVSGQGSIHGTQRLPGPVPGRSRPAQVPATAVTR